MNEPYITDIRYVAHDDDVAHILPFRWSTFRTINAVLSVEAHFDRPIGSIHEMFVFRDYSKRVSIVEMVDESGVSHYDKWPIAETLRTDLLNAAAIRASRECDGADVMPRTSSEASNLADGQAPLF